MIALCRRKGALKNVNMLTVSKSGRSYIPGKPLSSDLRHIIIDKIIDAGGNPLTMIFPGRFVYLVSVEHASVLGREPLLPFSSPEPVVSWSRGRETRVGYKLSRVALGTRMLCSVSAMFSTLWIPESTAGEANSKTLILMLLAPLSNKLFICKLKYFLHKSTRRQFHLLLL